MLVGYETSDDAGVYLVQPGLALVQTVDFFAPIVDDPRHYGQIAAANALSDIYAMGGKPKTALAVAGFPTTLDIAILGEIMRGGLEKLNEAGVALLGGHSIRDDEIKFGYSITGEVNPGDLKRNTTARAGNRIILTKPLGTGLITTALKKDKARPEYVDAALESMARLNRVASEIAVECKVDAMTDVTGFGLIGHALAVAKASSVSIEIDHRRLPLLPGALECSREDFCAGGLVSNRDYFSPMVRVKDEVSAEVVNILFDPQTSGGLLIFCAEKDSATLLQKLLDHGIDAVEIGRALESSTDRLTVY